MNKKLQSMYESGGLLKALLKDPAQAKMAMQMLGKQAKAAEGMAVNKTKLGMPGTAVPGAKNTYEGGGGVKSYRTAGKGMAMYANGGQSGPPGFLARLFGKKEEPQRRRTAKDAWQEAGYDREPVNWDRSTESTREAVYPKFYDDFTPMMAGTQKPGTYLDVGHGQSTPGTAEQIAREIRSQMETYDTGVETKAGGLAKHGAKRYQAVIPTVEDIMYAINNTSKMMKPGTAADGSPIGYGGTDQMTPMDVIRSGMTEYAGPDYGQVNPEGGDALFDAIIADAMAHAQQKYDMRLDKARNTQRGSGEGPGGRDVRGGETKEEYAERANRKFYRPEMKEYNLLQDYGDRLYESSYFGDEGYMQARGQAQADIRNAVIDMLNEAAGSNIYDRYRGQQNTFLQ